MPMLCRGLFGWQVTSWANLHSRGEALICHGPWYPSLKQCSVAGMKPPCFFCLVRWQGAAGCAFEGGQTEGCQDELPVSIGISSLALHSHFWLPRACGDCNIPDTLAVCGPTKSLLPRALALTPICALLSIQQLNCDSAGTSGWLPLRLWPAYRQRLSRDGRPKRRSGRKSGLHQVPRGRCGAGKYSSSLALLFRGCLCA